MCSSVQHILRTQDASIYRSSRQGDFQYDIPLKTGVYELRRHFAETFYGPEEIGSGGEGGSRTADVKVFTGISPGADPMLHLSFSSLRGGSAILSAIEILPGLQDSQRPVRIGHPRLPLLLQRQPLVGSGYLPQRRQLSSSENPAVDADDPEMYETERWGHFSYAIPVAPGRYDVNFHFIEHRFDSASRDRYGDSASEPGEARGRLFNVFCNGKLILRDLDLIKEAGETPSPGKEGQRSGTERPRETSAGVRPHPKLRHADRD